MSVTVVSGASGIEAVTVATKELGWTVLAYAEIEPFPCMVLNKHYHCGPPVNMPSPLCAPSPKEARAREAAIVRVGKIPPRAANAPVNMGDLRQMDGCRFHGRVNVWVAGTPCQTFSVAGLRAGLADERGNLALEYVRIANEIDADVSLWENVTGVLTSKDNAFGCFLGALCGHGGPLEPPVAGKRKKRARWANSGLVYGPHRTIAWRVLDAQFFGLAQRRKRVFVAACPRGGANPAAILFEWGGLRRDFAPGREERKDVAGAVTARFGRNGGAADDIDGNRVVTGALPSRWTAGGGLGTDFDCDGGLVAGTLESTLGRSRGAETPSGAIIAVYGGNNTSGSIDVSPALNAHGGGSRRLDFESEAFIAQTLRAEGFDASEDGTGRANLVVAPALTVRMKGDRGGTEGHIVPIAFDTTQITHQKNRSNPQPDAPGHALSAQAHVPAIAFHGSQDPDVSGDVTHPLGTNQGREVCVMQGRWRGDDGRGYDRPPHVTELPSLDTCKVDMVASVSLRGREGGGTAEFSGDVASALRSSQGGGDKSHCLQQSAVRRLMPTECEALQGFPRDYTRISGLTSWRDVSPEEDIPALVACGLQVRQTQKGKWRVNDPDGPRYKALGNSMAVPVIRWICRRIETELRRTGLVKESSNLAGQHTAISM